MKKIKLATTLVILLSVGISFTLEEYVPKVIMRAGWGKGYDKFGLEEGDLAYVAPNAIATDAEENIYILDPVNNRVVVFNNEGKYLKEIILKPRCEHILVYVTVDMVIDSLNHIYILSDYILDRSNTGIPLIMKYSKDGQLLYQCIQGSTRIIYDVEKATYVKFPSQEEHIKEILRIQNRDKNTNVLPVKYGMTKGIFIGANGNVYLITEGLSKENKVETYYINLKSAGLKDVRKLEVRGRISQDMKYIFIRRPDTPAIGGSWGGRLPDIEKLLLCDLKGRIIKSIPLNLEKFKKNQLRMFRATYQNSDTFGNHYFLTGVENEDYNFLIFKYNSDFKLVGIIDIYDHKPYAIANSGNIYQLFWDEKELDEGLKLIKWEKSR